MKAYTRESAHRENWKQQLAHWRSKRGKPYFFANNAEYLARLEALDFDKATDAERTAVLHEPYQMKCHECGEMQPVTIVVGEPPDYESATAQICLDCLKKAVEMAEEAYLIVITT